MHGIDLPAYRQYRRLRREGGQRGLDQVPGAAEKAACSGLASFLRPAADGSPWHVSVDVFGGGPVG
jgi:hypothetical protein